MTFRAVWALCATCVVAWSPAVVAQGQKAGPLTLPQALQKALTANARLTAAEREIGIAGPAAAGRRLSQPAARSSSTIRLGPPARQARRDDAAAQPDLRARRQARGPHRGGPRRSKRALGSAPLRLEMLLRRPPWPSSRCWRPAARPDSRPPDRRARTADAAAAAPRRGRRFVAGRDLRARRSPPTLVRPNASARARRCARARRELAARWARQCRNSRGRRRSRPHRQPAAVRQRSCGRRGQSAAAALDGGPGATRRRAALGAAQGRSRRAGQRRLAALPRDRRQRGAASACRSVAGLGPEPRRHPEAQEARQDRGRTRRQRLTLIAVVGRRLRDAQRRVARARPAAPFRDAERRGGVETIESGYAQGRFTLLDCSTLRTRTDAELREQEALRASTPPSRPSKA